MTEAEQLEESRRFSLQARRDLQDIRDLRNNQPFNRYWLRRLSTRIQILDDRFRNDDAMKCPHEEREILRRCIKELNDLSTMMDSDESNAKVSLERQG